MKFDSWCYLRWSTSNKLNVLVHSYSAINIDFKLLLKQDESIAMGVEQPLINNSWFSRPGKKKNKKNNHHITTKTNEWLTQWSEDTNFSDNNVLSEISTWRIFSPFSPLHLWSNFLWCGFLSLINDYIAPIAIFTTWAKIYSAKYFCNATVAG